MTERFEQVGGDLGWTLMCCVHCGWPKWAYDVCMDAIDEYACACNLTLRQRFVLWLSNGRRYM